MKAELITEVSQIGPIEDRWRALAESRGNAFVTPEWFRSWAHHSPTSPLIATVRGKDGELAGDAAGPRFRPAAAGDPLRRRELRGPVRS